MRKIFTLSTCDTSRKILKETGLIASDFEIQDIKKTAISQEDLEAMKELAGSYEALFSRRSQQYKALGLKNMNLTEDDYKYYILQEYTFLKRPVVVDGDQIFIGNSLQNVNKLQEYLKRIT